MILEITPDIITKLRKEDFYPDEMISEYMVLKALEASDIELLDNYDDFNSSKRAVISYQNLFRKGYIDKNKEGANVFFKLTDKGRDFIKELTPEKKQEFEWIEEWVNLFPEKKPDGDILRDAPQDCLPRMKTFIKKYKYEKELIFTATKSYLISESAKSFKYCKRSIYFINKQKEGSLLASWCKQVDDNFKTTGIMEDSNKTQLIQTVN